MSPKILIVDDEQCVLEMTKYLFKMKKYTVVTAMDGDEALEAVRKENFDIVLLDIKMPGINGIEVLKRMKGMHPHLPVVIITVYYDQSSALRSVIENEADGCIRKPFDIENLMMTVEKVLQKKSQ